MIKHSMAGSKFYIVWSNMKQRCLNPDNPSYKNYGARGIGVCDEWLEFENFLKDMLEGYDENLSIERIDNSKGYSKENCKWATTVEQIQNRRRQKFSGNSTGIKYIYKIEYDRYAVKLPNKNRRTFDTIQEAKEFIELIKIKGV